MEKPVLIVSLVPVGLAGCRPARAATEAQALAQVRSWTLAHWPTNNLPLDSATASPGGRWWWVHVPKPGCRDCLPNDYLFRVKQRSGKVRHMRLK